MASKKNTTAPDDSGSTLVPGGVNHMEAGGGKRTDDSRYTAVTQERVLALWEECGRDRVKGLQGHGKMTINEIREKLGPVLKAD